MKAAICSLMLGLVLGLVAYGADGLPAGSPSGVTPVQDPKSVGGEDASIVQVANLIYARVKSSKCFSGHFLERADKESAISTSPRFHAVKLESDDLSQFPFVIMTGEGSFQLTDEERANLRKYCEGGGFLLASAGCSSEEWNTSFRREVRTVWPDVELKELPAAHPVFHTVYDIERLGTKHGEPRPLEGLHYNGNLVLLYSQDGLNDTANTTGCCCCGGNEIANAEQVNVNILAYALTF